MRLAHATLLIAPLAGCNAAFGIGDLTFEEASGGYAGAGGTAAGVGGSGGEATGGAGAGGSTGGAPPVTLSDRGLIVRYYLDEPVDSDIVEDAAPAPLNLGRSSDPNLSLVPTPGRSGARWVAAAGGGYFSAAIDGSKVRDRLDGSQTATIEIVAAIKAIAAFDRLLHIGLDGDYGRLSLSTDAGAGGLMLAARTVDSEVAAWSVPLFDAERAVYHVVIDIAAPMPNDRAKLFVDGSSAPLVIRAAQMPFMENETIVIDAKNEFVLGNRPLGDRSVGGDITYAALYDVALSQEVIQTHVQILTADDDTP